MLITKKKNKKKHRRRGQITGWRGEVKDYSQVPFASLMRHGSSCITVCILLMSLLTSDDCHLYESKMAKLQKSEAK